MSGFQKIGAEQRLGLAEAQLLLRLLLVLVYWPFFRLKATSLIVSLPIGCAILIGSENAVGLLR